MVMEGEAAEAEGVAANADERAAEKAEVRKGCRAVCPPSNAPRLADERTCQGMLADDDDDDNDDDEEEDEGEEDGEAKDDTGPAWLGDLGMSMGFGDAPDIV
jgi:hypothetical protein